MLELSSLLLAASRQALPCRSIAGGGRPERVNLRCCTAVDLDGRRNQLQSPGELFKKTLFQWGSPCLICVGMYDIFD